MGWQIIGHNWAVTLLQRGLETGRVAHATLLCGPPQVGKTRLALTLAQALNCGEPGRPCGQCASCRKVEKDTHPDVRLIEGEGAGGGFKIDQIRDVKRESVLSPYEGPYRIFVLRRIDLASIEAANSLLKLLEEPPDPVVLVLTAVQGDRLPATVVSRCQRLDLRPVARGVIEAALREKGVPAPKAQLLARLSGGRVGWALDVSRDEHLLQQRQEDLDQLQRVLSSGLVDRLDYAWQASRDVAASRATIELWTTWWRDLLLLHQHGEDHVVNVDRGEELGRLSGQSNPFQIQRVLSALQDTVAQLDAYVNPRLALEGLLLKLPRWQTWPQDQTGSTDT
jgi:DNA polymerase-3 subunit delta'